MNKRQETALKTKQKIIEAADKLTKDKGFENITVDEIVQEANVAKGTFYVYFKKKEDVISGIWKDELSNIQSSSYDKNGSVEERISNFLINSTKYIVKNDLKVAQQWFRMTFEYKNTDGIKKIEFDKKSLTNIIEDSIDKKELKKDIPVEQISEDLVATFYGYVIGWCMSDSKIDPVKSIKRYCKNTLPNILKPYKK